MNPIARSRSCAGGFSLIELLIVIAILGFSAAMAVPGAVSWVRGLSVRNTAEGMRAGIEKTRLEALRANTSMTFWLMSSGADQPLDNHCGRSSTGTSWVISVLNPAGSCLAAPSATAEPMLVERWSGREGGTSINLVGTSAAGAAADSVTFNSLGQVEPTGVQLAQIDITHQSGDGRRLRVQIDPGGSVRTCDRDVAAGDPRACQ